MGTCHSLAQNALENPNNKKARLWKIGLKKAKFIKTQTRAELSAIETMPMRQVLGVNGLSIIARKLSRLGFSMTGAGNKNQSVVVSEIVALLSQLKSGKLTGQITHATGDESLKPIVDAANALAQHLQAQARIQSDPTDVRFIVDSLGIGVWKWNLETNDLDWDKNMCSLYGCDPKDFTGANDAWESSLSSETKAKAVEERNVAVKGGQPFDTTFQVVHKETGALQEIRTRAFLIRDAAGKAVKMWGIDLDRSREAEIENALKSSAKFLEQTGALAKVGGWELDLKTGQVHMT